MTLGRLIELLKAKPQDVSVSFDFCRVYPTTVDSWRGIYAELALGWTEGYEGRCETVGALVKELESAVGRTFTGYKGGDYVMDADTPLHVDNYGMASNTDIVAVTGGKWGVVLETATTD